MQTSTSPTIHARSLGRHNATSRSSRGSSGSLLRLDSNLIRLVHGSLYRLLFFGAECLGEVGVQRWLFVLQFCHGGNQC